MAKTPTAKDTTSEEDLAPAEEEKPPETRYVSVSVDIVLKVADDSISADDVEWACKDQLVLPAHVSVNMKPVNLVGVVSNGVGESEKPVEIDSGYGRDVPPKEEK